MQRLSDSKVDGQEYEKICSVIVLTGEWDLLGEESRQLRHVHWNVLGRVFGVTVPESNHIVWSQFHSQAWKWPIEKKKCLTI